MWNIETVNNRLNNYTAASIGDDCGFFTSECPLCDGLAGDRVEMFYLDQGAVYNEHVCNDCALYIANGDLPE